MEEFEDDLLALMAKHDAVDRDELISVLEPLVMALREEADGEGET